MAGICFPSTGKGKPSTTAFGKDVFSSMATALGDKALAQAINDEKDWRHKYNKYLSMIMDVQVRASTANPELVIDSLRIGLERSTALSFEIAEGQAPVPLAEAVKLATSPGFETARVVGTGARMNELSIPYDDRVLSGDALAAQADEWARIGTIEADCAEAIKLCRVLKVSKDLAPALEHVRISFHTQPSAPDSTCTAHLGSDSSSEIL